jgi:hypothetical protein
MPTLRPIATFWTLAAVLGMLYFLVSYAASPNDAYRKEYLAGAFMSFVLGSPGTAFMALDTFGARRNVSPRTYRISCALLIVSCSLAALAVAL